jgi:hypothetical protein
MSDKTKKDDRKVSVHRQMDRIFGCICEEALRGLEKERNETIDDRPSWFNPYVNRRF